MTATEVRLAIERCKEILLHENWQELSLDQRAFLCHVVGVEDDPVDILLAYESFRHPLQATVKKHRFGQKKFWLDGVLDGRPQNAFSTKEDAERFAYSKGVELIWKTGS